MSTSDLLGTTEPPAAAPDPARRLYRVGGLAGVGAFLAWARLLEARYLRAANHGVGADVPSRCTRRRCRRLPVLFPEAGQWEHTGEAGRGCWQVTGLQRPVGGGSARLVGAGGGQCRETHGR